MPVKRKSSRNAPKLSRNVKINSKRPKRASQKKRGRKASRRQRGGDDELNILEKLVFELNTYHHKNPANGRSSFAKHIKTNNNEKLNDILVSFESCEHKQKLLDLSEESLILLIKLIAKKTSPGDSGQTQYEFNPEASNILTGVLSGLNSCKILTGGGSCKCKNPTTRCKRNNVMGNKYKGQCYCPTSGWSHPGQAC